MKYGLGFWVVRDGVRLKDRSSPSCYPETRGFEYADGTGDRGEFLTEDFCVDYVPPGWNSLAVRMAITGSRNPVLRKTAFDFDWASIPAPFRGLLTCDKADHRIRVAALFHDMGYCVHEFLPFMKRRWWDTFLAEAMEAYLDDGRRREESLAAHAVRAVRERALVAKVEAGVRVGGGFCWPKPEADVLFYRGLFSARIIPL